jgi:hypothetical protein
MVLLGGRIGADSVLFALLMRGGLLKNNISIFRVCRQFYDPLLLVRTNKAFRHFCQ